MRYITDRKRVQGMGSAKSGTEHFWSMKVSSVALLFLIPVFIFMFGGMLGKPHAEVLAFFSRPIPAVVVALTMIVGFEHFKGGVHVMIEDYVHGMAQKICIIGMTCVSYTAMAVGLFAIAKIAL